MKQVKYFLLRAIAVFALVAIAQSAVFANYSDISPLAPPKTLSPRATFLQFVDTVRNMLDRHSRVVKKEVYPIHLSDSSLVVL